MNKDLLIIGADGHGKVVKETALAMRYFDRVDFLDDNSELAIGKCQDFKKHLNDYSYGFVAFGNNVQRMKWTLQLIEVGFQLPILIHPTAYISPLARIELGTIVCAMAVVSNNAIIKKGCIISIGALVDYDSCIGEGSHINSGAIVKAVGKVERLKKVDAGMIYSMKRN